LSARRRARLRLAAVAAGVVALTSGCQLTTAVGIDANRDGSGMVRVAVGLDADAARRVPNLKQDLRTDDLTKAGWTIVGPRKEDDGRTWIRASKPFDDPGDATEVITEISGVNGPFKDFHLARSRSFLTTKTEFSGTVDLKGGIEAFGDDQLRQRLGGSSIGIDTKELESRIGQVLDRIFTFRVQARLPGDVDTNAPLEADQGAEWRPKLGEAVTLVATSSALNTRQVVGTAVAVVAVLALAILLVVRRLRHRADPAWR
jgi:hypothetical protein